MLRSRSFTDSFAQAELPGDLLVLECRRNRQSLVEPDPAVGLSPSTRRNSVRHPVRRTLLQTAPDQALKQILEGHTAPMRLEAEPLEEGSFDVHSGAHAHDATTSLL